ncbi:gliding motility lipoprotein GldD [Halosquirtibacter xylanolyticus]|uniref:gliding motility lipoprotein GldD n=1 Tax=Halosquirtibacter xylanolyticus TaxID=3374599 RepID=UPI003749CEFA|nr:gliding motility lipoprotein GldD [Prolixibacteraceae bacterium]
MKYILALFIAITIISCKDNVTPKPKGYFRITFPIKNYTEINSIEPFHFELPQYATIVKENAKKEDQFYNVHFKDNEANIYLSYFKVKNNLPSLIEEAHKWAFKHSIRADAIEQRQYANDQNNTYGLVYTIEGNAASPVQFYLTDSTHNFLRGALYFNNVPNQDSLQPVINFISEDIIKLIETTHWNE